MSDQKKKLSDMDNLRLKCLGLEMQNAILMLEKLQKELQGEMGKKDVLQKSMKELADEFTKTYGIDMMTVQIDPEGVIHPLPQALPPKP